MAKRRRGKRRLFDKPVIVKATIKTVLDGDTFRLSTERSIRLIGVDCPELTRRHFGGGRRWDPDPGAVAAKDFLREFLQGREADLECWGQDVYGRTLAHVLCDGQDIGLRLLEEGLGWAGRWEWKYLVAQWQAQRARRGLWASADGLGLVAYRSPGNFLLGMFARLWG